MYLCDEILRKHFLYLCLSINNTPYNFFKLKCTRVDVFVYKIMLHLWTVISEIFRLIIYPLSMYWTRFMSVAQITFVEVWFFKTYYFEFHTRLRGVREGVYVFYVVSVGTYVSILRVSLYFEYFREPNKLFPSADASSGRAFSIRFLIRTSQFSHFLLLKSHFLLNRCHRSWAAFTFVQ